MMGGRRGLEDRRGTASEQKQRQKTKKYGEGKGGGWSIGGMSLFSHLSHTQMFGEERRSREEDWGGNRGEEKVRDATSKEGTRRRRSEARGARSGDKAGDKGRSTSGIQEEDGENKALKGETRQALPPRFSSTEADKSPESTSDTTRLSETLDHFSLSVVG